MNLANRLPTITTNSKSTELWAKAYRSFARSKVSALCHDRFVAAFIIDISKSNIRYTQH